MYDMIHCESSKRTGVGVRLNTHGLQRDDEVHDRTITTLDVLRGLLECRLSTFIKSEITSSAEGWGRRKDKEEEGDTLVSMSANAQSLRDVFRRLVSIIDKN